MLSAAQVVGDDFDGLEKGYLRLSDAWPPRYSEDLNSSLISVAF
jgi:hypothetical protein